MRIDAIATGKNPPKTSTSSSRCRSAANRSSTNSTRRPDALRRPLSAHVHALSRNYGFVPHTLSGDGDPVDVLVCNTRALVPGCVINVRPIGVLVMEDNAGQDEKIVAVPSPKLTLRYQNVTEYTQLPDITIHQVEHFFQHYKDLEPGKWVKIQGWHGSERAKQMIVEGIARKQGGQGGLIRTAACGRQFSWRSKDGSGTSPMTSTRSSAPQAKSRTLSSAMRRAVSFALGLPVATTSPTAQPSPMPGLAHLLDHQNLGSSSSRLPDR